MEAANCDALMLAYAGVTRMGYDHLIAAESALDEFVPASGAGQPRHRMVQRPLIRS
ncbi:MAG: hypothetical protein R2860_15795 [Desulfobacterales bacterium]